MVARTRNARGIYHKSRSRFTKSPGKSKALPEFLEQAEVEALLRYAPHPQARLLMLMQWRAGLRVSEAIAITAADLALESDQPTIRVRLGRERRTVWSRCTWSCETCSITWCTTERRTVRS